jgi:hypothetical protein
MFCWKCGTKRVLIHQRARYRSMRYCRQTKTFGYGTSTLPSNGVTWRINLKRCSNSRQNLNNARRPLLPGCPVTSACKCVPPLIKHTPGHVVNFVARVIPSTAFRVLHEPDCAKACNDIGVSECCPSASTQEAFQPLPLASGEQ